MFKIFKGKDKDSSVSFKNNFRPKKHPAGTTRYTLRKSWKAGLLNGTMIKDSVKCPQGEDENDWVAIHTIEIYNTVNYCYAFVQDFCTDQTCPKMTGNKATYLWSDGKDKPQELPAKKYIDNLSNWIADQIDNTDIFPIGDSYSKQFKPAVKKILSRILRVYSHIYHEHWSQIKSVGADKHINTSLKYFHCFVLEFGLVDDTDLGLMKNVFDSL
ncbi:Mob1-like protein [Cavenderia fasciculata]|uniref:Mob1-like protein n=1 Tax=Cavenderia fasciculata TaxID=261658 RepID=F4PWS1_CACFS|nr:Mob1-like protein [Cavenderia fasciculata]EGG20435.1 Mob1-like protein [Cavenderia fasciculata]|eukprot:XP_004367418.1 Mob1-like protein [Cavenderia fasciculata]